MVGCREEELQPAEAPWIPSRFELRDRVTPIASLVVSGEIVARPGDRGEVTKVLREAPTGVQYQVYFDGRTLQVPERFVEFAGGRGEDLLV